MSIKDIESLFAREQRASEHPWSMGDLSQSLKSEDDCQIVCLHTGDAGYFVLQHNEGVTEILNLVIFLKYQRMGIGREVLSLIFSEAMQKQSNEVWLEVREGNKVARRLYKGAGFIQKGVRKNYYPSAAGNKFSAREDAILMTRAIG